MATYVARRGIYQESTAGNYVLRGGIFQDTTSAAITAELTGTATSSITETDVTDGGKTIILTLTGDTWVASGATFNAQRQAIIDGISAATSPALAWNDEWRDKEVVGAVARTSDTACTITMSSQATISGSYDISAQETITATIPAAALVTSASDVVASPIFTVDIVSAAAMAGTLSLMGVGI